MKSSPPGDTSPPATEGDANRESELINWAKSLARGDQGAFELARKTIERAIEEPDYDPSEDVKLVVCGAFSTHIPGYSSLNYVHIEEVKSVVRSMQEYVKDSSLKRPRNFMMLASPGAGKSHLVNCIGEQIGREQIGVVSFNMATMQSNQDIESVVDAARNIVVDHKIPIVFLDEFDSNDANYSLLLPLLWDGTLNAGHRELRIGRSIFILAGSRHTLPELLEHARRCLPPGERERVDSKLVDLISRISGAVVKLPSLASTESTVDKVVLAMHLLRRRFRNCQRVPKGFLWFIAHADFRYDARSITTLIDQIPLCSESADVKREIGPEEVVELTTDDLNALPLRSMKNLKSSPLAFHLFNEDSVGGLVDLWKESLKRTAPQLIYHEDANFFRPSHPLFAGVDLWVRFYVAIPAILNDCMALSFGHKRSATDSTPTESASQNRKARNRPQPQKKQPTTVRAAQKSRKKDRRRTDRGTE